MLMQSRGGGGPGGCPLGGWSAAAFAPAPPAWPARLNELDLVPCSGYGALSTRAGGFT